MAEVPDDQTEDKVRRGGPGTAAAHSQVSLSIPDYLEVEVLNPLVSSVEGGAECETKKVKLEAGKAKCKLKAADLKPMQLRVVPLDKAGKQEAWVPEFLFTVEEITGAEVRRLLTSAIVRGCNIQRDL